MKRILILLLCGLFALALVAGCGQKEQTQEGTAAGAPEEMADSTRMDSAAMDTTMDTTMPDTSMTTDSAAPAEMGTE
ncbi:MAG: hypothetical protein PVH24_02050 [Candidatus Zixiibacteriota bacterium]